MAERVSRGGLFGLLLAAALALTDGLIIEPHLVQKRLVVVRPALGHHVVGQYLPAPALDHLLQGGLDRKSVV